MVQTWVAADVSGKALAAGSAKAPAASAQWHLFQVGTGFAPGF